jgi:(p)ppGpp synthase/HD superfamily hydrolase
VIAALLHDAVEDQEVPDEMISFDDQRTQLFSGPHAFDLTSFDCFNASAA